MNRIPRNFKSIIATPLCGNCENRQMIITKDEIGYHGAEIATGKLWCVPVAHLRNDHFFRIDSIEK